MRAGCDAYGCLCGDELESLTERAEDAEAALRIRDRDVERERGLREQAEREADLQKALRDADKVSSGKGWQAKDREARLFMDERDRAIDALRAECRRAEALANEVLDYHLKPNNGGERYAMHSPGYGCELCNIARRALARPGDAAAPAVAESSTGEPAPPTRWHKGMRESYWNTCWAYVNDNDVISA